MMDPTEVRYRLSYWLRQSTAFEKLAASVLALEGYTSIKPSQPYGGADGGKDATLVREGHVWEMAAHCSARGEPASELRRKFESDLEKVVEHYPHGIAFVTNQKITVKERDHFHSLAAETGLELDLYDLDALEHRLSQPDAEHLRQDYLGISPDPWPDQARAWAADAARSHGRATLNHRHGALAWPILAETPEGGLTGVLLLRRGQQLEALPLADLIAHWRDESQIVLLCDHGVDLQEATEALKQLAAHLDLDAQEQRTPSSKTHIVVYLGGPSYADISTTVDAAVQGLAGGIAMPTLTWVDIRRRHGDAEN